MSESTITRCSQCGAPTEFSPSAQALVCPYCRARHAIAARPPTPEQPIDNVPDAHAVRDSGLRTASCRNCGAQAEIPAVTAATKCAFCTHPLVISPESVSRVPADNVVPFRLDKQGAASAFASWLSGLWFRPNDLKTAAKLDHIRGVYIPAWVYSAQAMSQWTAESGYHYYEQETVYVNGQPQTRNVQKTRWQPAYGQHHGNYRDIIVEASKGLSEEELHQIEPFQLNGAMVAYSDEFLAGFEAECLSSTARSAWVPGETRVQALERGACAGQVPGDTHRNLQVQTQTGYVQALSTLVPVYVAAYLYDGKVFRLLVNGQTSKVVGKAPWSVPKIVAAVVGGVVAVGTVVALLTQ